MKNKIDFVRQTIENRISLRKRIINNSNNYVKLLETEIKAYYDVLNIIDKYYKESK